MLENSGSKLFGEKLIKILKKTGKRRMKLLMLFCQTRRREECPTTIVHIIMVLSLDSDSPFRRGPLVDLQRAEDLGTSSTETTNISRRSLTGTSTISNYREERNSYICRRKVKLIFCNRVTKIRNKHRILNLNLQIIDPKKCYPCRGGE